ncbi:restriction endonuclease subunit S [Pseudanabaena mucicola]|uniref:Restriction endonuclease subunit S n=1 Tax=Pseudanabaena mucicola FACHB-723 TaxID=2692860 RepID=A0ABR7ZX32_9CYAN|nr:restriction endonuclease subunit S [Pseudanabaena mucicola]MBD2187948.1 restriction endonuclease subunit S [Pseudanabaena mucicola FACHB-723]
MMREDWIEVELGDVCFTTSGGTPSRSKSEYYKGTIPWVKSGELNYNIILDTEEHISDEAVQKSSAKIFPEGTLLIALYGATIGKLAILGVPATTNQAICGIYKNELFETKFLFNYLLHKRQKLIEQGTGGAQPNISQTILKKLPLPLAPLPEQRAIAAKIEQLFSELDNGIANLKTAKSKLEIYRQAILKQAFEGELTKEWRHQQKKLLAVDELLAQIKKERTNYYETEIKEWNKAILEWEANEKKEIKPTKPRKPEEPTKASSEQLDRMWTLPKFWTWTQLGCIAFVTKLAGFEYTKYVKYDESGDLAVIKAENASKKGFNYTNFSKIKSETVKHLKRSQIKGDELLVVFVGAGTGNVALVPQNSKFFLGPNISMVRPYFSVNTKFIEFFLRSPIGNNLLMTSVKAVAQPSLSMETIRQVPIAFPNLIEQDQIVQEIETRLSVCDKLNESIDQSLEKAQALRQSILKKAFEGKLLSQDELQNCRQQPDWEPAAKLLERVKNLKKQM